MVGRPPPILFSRCPTIIYFPCIIVPPSAGLAHVTFVSVENICSMTQIFFSIALFVV